MSSNTLFGNFRPRLNVAPLLLTPGFAAIGYAVGGAQSAGWCVAAWLAVVLGAAVSCGIHAVRGGNEDDLRTGRRAFDYDPNKLGH